LGVATAVYLEEYGHKNRLTSLIDISLSNWQDADRLKYIAPNYTHSS
jgi:hypothetical protein